MILNLSSSLAKKLACRPQATSTDPPLPFQEWYGHIFYAARKPYILTIEAGSIFTTIIESKGILDPEDYADSLVIEVKNLCKLYGLQKQAFEILSSRSEGITVNKSSNRSLVAHVNEMIYHARSYMEERNMDRIEAAILVNEMPIKMKKFEYAIELFGGVKVRKLANNLHDKLMRTAR
jgi:hypothetical protein